MMEQEGDGSRRGVGEMNNQPRDRVQPQPPPQQPQLCPRCDSLNTKFCYYNNYSLSQPRYFCKTCRRYWTQGGTLRNVPVGGGSRKGKRAKNSSSASSSSENSQPQQQKVVASLSPSVPSIATFYGSGGGYLASLAAFNQLNNPPSHPFGGGDLASSNLGLLHGFNAAAASVVSQHQIHPSQFYHQMGSMSLYTSEQGSLIPSSMGNSTSAAAAATHHDWPQSFINNINASARASDDASLWSTLSTTYLGAGGNSNRTAAGAGSSLVPNQWPDLQGFHPHPPPPQ